MPNYISNRTALSEKKTVLKPKSPEKSRPEEKDTEKSPAKKLEGNTNPSAPYAAYYSIRLPSSTVYVRVFVCVCVSLFMFFCLSHISHPTLLQSQMRST